MAPKTDISWMTPSETLLRLGLGGFGDVKWAWGGGWCLPVFFFRISSSPGPCFDIQLLSDLTAPFSRPKNSSKTCAPQGASPVWFGVRERWPLQLHCNWKDEMKQAKTDKLKSNVCSRQSSRVLHLGNIQLHLAKTCASGFCDPKNELEVFPGTKMRAPKWTHFLSLL